MPNTFRAHPKDQLIGTMVCDLMDPLTHMWVPGLIQEGFNEVEAKLILSTPISWTGGCDKLVWFHSRNGVYSVRSGYGVALELMENGMLGRKGRGAGSEKSKHHRLWNSIWALDVPNKLKFFIWKWCHHSLAVRRNLARRNMRIDNVCSVCGKPDETENHIFFQCVVSHLFWFGSCLQLNSYELEGTDFLQSWENFGNKVKGCDNSNDLLQEFVFGLWRLWKNRNDDVFKGLEALPSEIVKLWEGNLAEFRDRGKLSSQDAQVQRPGRVGRRGIREAAGKNRLLALSR